MLAVNTAFTMSTVCTNLCTMHAGGDYRFQQLSLNIYNPMYVKKGFRSKNDFES